ncbi:Rrf2 family transcriptional regulator [Fodinibius salsisoli]|uniref:Rrf2 family transcriptional regulator n=1 Tax=Fodinibius salsisoli TaxID=2820877 RepID=A0ABT3PHQ4_9BACT|nr:Rrf2 family transcriptional regulator [Fodinibius salsisoli]MCW9705446.1 Rrf2 family transcriptional regulator [Fodinibius salsisoli]
MNNTRFAIAIHILTLLDHSGKERLSSKYLAGSINANAAMVRKELSNLNAHGLVESKAGKYGGSSLAKPADAIKLSDVYRAVRQTPALGSKRDHPNPHCPVGKEINDHLSDLYQETEDILMSRLGERTLAEFSRQFA